MHEWDTKEGVMLQLHLGLGAGTVLGVDLGNQYRREFVVAGEPLKQLSEAEQQAESGQVVLSPQAWDYVKDVCEGTPCPTHPEFGPGFAVVSKMTRPMNQGPQWRSHLIQALRTDKERARPALQTMYLYVPGTCRPHLLSGKLYKASEFREVTMMFIRIGGLHYGDSAFAARFQRVVFLILSAVYRYEGALSRLSIDDKGTCAKACYHCDALVLSKSAQCSPLTSLLLNFYWALAHRQHLSSITSDVSQPTSHYLRLASDHSPLITHSRLSTHN